MFVTFYNCQISCILTVHKFLASFTTLLRIGFVSEYVLGNVLVPNYDIFCKKKMQWPAVL